MNRRLLRHGALVLAVGLTPALATAGTLTGTVTGEDGSAVVNGRIEIFAADGRALVPDPLYTDSAGHYAANVPEGACDIVYRAPVGVPLANRSVENVVVVGSIYRHETMLPDGVTISGVVTDPNGVPQVRVLPQFRDAVTGEEWLTLCAPSDALGRWSATVPAGTWDVAFIPPADAPGAGCVALPGLAIASPMTRNVQLPQTVDVGVHVTDPTGAALFGARVEVFDALVPGFDPAVTDVTDASGNVTLHLPTRDFDIRVTPPQDRAVMVATLRDVKVRGPVTLPEVRCEAGSFVTGRVRDAATSAGVPRVEVRFEKEGGGVFPIATATTNASGFFTAVVPDGDYMVDLRPMAGSRVARSFVDGFNVDGAASPLVTLPHAWLFKARVIDGTGAPVPAADVRVNKAGTDFVVPTANDASDRFGNVQVSLPNGQHEIDVVPAVATGLAGVRIRQDMAGSDVSVVDVVLPQGMLVSGRATDDIGRPVGGVEMIARDATTGETQPIAGGTTDAFGDFAVRLPAGTWTLEAVPPTPLRGASVTATVGGDTDVGTLVLASAIAVSGHVVDASGLPLRNARVTFTSPTDAGVVAQEMLTDGFGAFSRGLLRGPAQVRIEPVPGSPLKGAVRAFDVVGPLDLGTIMLGTGDLDGDGWGDMVDLCPAFTDPNQIDRDFDGRGDLCDNCRIISNASQADADRDGTGDPCEFTWGDVAPIGAPNGVLDVSDLVVALRMSVGIVQASPHEILRVNVAPADLTPASPADIMTPRLVDQTLDVSDIVLMLRAVAGVVALSPPR